MQRVPLASSIRPFLRSSRFSRSSRLRSGVDHLVTVVRPLANCQDIELFAHRTSSKISKLFNCGACITQIIAMKRKNVEEQVANARPKRRALSDEEAHSNFRSGLFDDAVLKDYTTEYSASKPYGIPLHISLQTCLPSMHTHSGSIARVIVVQAYAHARMNRGSNLDFLSSTDIDMANEVIDTNMASYGSYSIQIFSEVSGMRYRTTCPSRPKRRTSTRSISLEILQTSMAWTMTLSVDYPPCFSFVMPFTRQHSGNISRQLPAPVH